MIKISTLPPSAALVLVALAAFLVRPDWPHVVALALAVGVLGVQLYLRHVEAIRGVALEARFKAIEDRLARIGNKVGLGQ